MFSPITRVPKIPFSVFWFVFLWSNQDLRHLDLSSFSLKSVLYSISNYRSVDNNDGNSTSDGTVTFRASVTDIHRPGGDNEWESEGSYIYNINQTILPNNPDLPPATITRNDVSKGLQGIVYACFALIFIATIGVAIWTYINRNCRVIIASQPM